jgi:nicotinate dehydrogenase subunit B
MAMKRREFLAAMGSAGLVYAFRLSPIAAGQQTPWEITTLDFADEECVANFINLDYRDWIAFSPGGSVSVFSGRTELGQGLKTVVTAIVIQGLDISQEQLTVVLGDTELCPDDGPTTGSSSTTQVGWGFWLACGAISEDLVSRAALRLGVNKDSLEFKQGGVGFKDQPGTVVLAPELGEGRVIFLDIDPKSTPAAGKQYVDRAILNVQAQDIVTGRLKYAGDLHFPGMLYADWLTPPYHPYITGIESAELTSAEQIQDVERVKIVRDKVVAVGRRFTAVQKALKAARVTWKKPSRPKTLNIEGEIRARARLVSTLTDRGDVAAGLSTSDFVLSETYSTQYTIQSPMETDTAVARVEGGRQKVTVWAGSQHPFKHREITSRAMNIPEERIHVIGMPVGGGFGGKTSNPVVPEAAVLSQWMEAPVKLMYSRRNQFQLKGSYKAACVIDLTSGVGADGRLRARRLDIHMDVGFGSKDTYVIPNELARLYTADWPFRRAVSRGTSYVQTCFAIESHMDMLAASIGMDPFEFRRINAQHRAFVSLIDACAEMIRYRNDDTGPDEGIGLAIVKHGAQLCAVAARVSVDRLQHRVKVKHLCCALDVGPIINRNTVTVGTRGAMTWGIGYALKEKIDLDGHSARTSLLHYYGMPQFSDVPPMDIAFLDEFDPGRPRGCGEVPVIPTIGAIVNAVYKATGVRFYSTPLGPENLRKHLG